MYYVYPFLLPSGQTVCAGWIFLPLTPFPHFLLYYLQIALIYAAFLSRYSLHIRLFLASNVILLYTRIARKKCEGPSLVTSSATEQIEVHREYLFSQNSTKI